MGLQSQMLKGFIFLQQELWVWGLEVGLRTLNPVGDLCNRIIFQFLGHPPSGWASLIAQLVKNLPAMRETLVQFLGQEDLLEEG